MPKAMTPTSSPSMVTSTRRSPELAVAEQVPPPAVSDDGVGSGGCPGPSATKSRNAIQAGAVRVQSPVRVPSQVYTMYFRPFLNSYPQETSRRSVSTVNVAKRGPFQMRLTPNSTVTSAADESRYGEVPLNFTEVTSPANTASASASASAGEPAGAHEQAWAVLVGTNKVSRHRTTATAPALPTRVMRRAGIKTARPNRYWANNPPSITNSLPVMKDDSSDARNSTP